MKNMGRKAKLTLSVDKNLVTAAKDIGINLSAFLEIQLRQYLAVLKNGYTQCGGRDSNPRTPTGQDPQSCAFVRSATPA